MREESFKNTKTPGDRLDCLSFYKVLWCFGMCELCGGLLVLRASQHQQGLGGCVRHEELICVGQEMKDARQKGARDTTDF